MVQGRVDTGTRNYGRSLGREIREGFPGKGYRGRKERLWVYTSPGVKVTLEEELKKGEKGGERSRFLPPRGTLQKVQERVNPEEKREKILEPGKRELWG